MSANPYEMPGASDPGKPREAEEAVEIFPILFDKDYLDFRGVQEADEIADPKSSTAPASVETPSSPTGLEDVSEEDLDNPVQVNAERDTSPVTPSETSTQTSSPES